MNPNDRLKFIREHLGLTQKDIAIQLGIKRINVTNLESGKVKISTLHALAIEYRFNISADWLLKGVGEMLLKDISIQEPSKNDLNNIDKQTPDSSSNMIELEHISLIKGFKNKEKAKIINENLIELEKVDKDSFDHVASYIEGALSTAKIIKCKNKAPAHEDKKNLKNGTEDK